MADAVGVAGNRVRSFVERIEQLEQEIAELNEAKKEVFAEANRPSKAPSTGSWRRSSWSTRSS